MGGHGGLNILPQKRWNVYNYENREKVRRDEEAAAKEEQLKREQSRKRDSEVRLEKLRQTRGLTTQGPGKPDEKSSSATTETEFTAEPSKPADSNHINLFDGIRIFDPIKSDEGKGEKRKSKFASDDNRNKKVKKEEVRILGPEDEKYRLGYGIAGKGVKLPWYMEKREAEEKNVNEDDTDDEKYNDVKSKEKRKSVAKKSLDELREERLKRERSEKERERALLMKMSKKNRGFSSRRG